jgi:hypothetical protein
MKKGIFFLLVCFGLGFLPSCDTQKILTDPNLALQLENDSIVFDTVFTTRGSATEWLKIYNPHPGPIVIDEIFLAGKRYTGKSPYRLNINGQPVNEVADVELAAGDSMYVFAEVTLDPNGANAPLLVTDSIVFKRGNKETKIQLVAYGQDAIYLYQDQVPCGEVWTDQKPYVIVDYAYVAPNCTLTLREGTRVFMGKNAQLAVAGNLQVLGSKSKPVTFRGDRLDAPYASFTGAYQGIHFYKESVGNFINFADIRNGSIGIQCDSFVVGRDNLVVKNTRISNQLYVGILGLSARIKAENCLVADCGKYNIYGALGGNYEFLHCTVGNSDQQFGRKDAAVTLNNVDHPSGTSVNTALSATFKNCIIWGNLNDELDLDSAGSKGFSTTFERCIIKTNTVTTPNWVTKGYLNATANKLNENPRFKSSTDYRIDTLSPCYRYGSAQGVLKDLDDVNRDLILPTVGCYERKE